MMSTPHRIRQLEKFIYLVRTYIIKIIYIIGIRQIGVNYILLFLVCNYIQL